MGDPIFDYRDDGGDKTIRQQNNGCLVPKASGVGPEIRESYVNMLLFDAESIVLDNPHKAVDQLHRAYRIAVEECDSGNPHITVDVFYTSHVGR